MPETLTDQNSIAAQHTRDCLQVLAVEGAVRVDQTSRLHVPSADGGSPVHGQPDDGVRDTGVDDKRSAARRRDTLSGQDLDPPLLAIVGAWSGDVDPGNKKKIKYYEDFLIAGDGASRLFASTKLRER